jgi:HAE1 family hydrophobic/amphiphilic exporter-1
MKRHLVLSLALAVAACQAGGEPLSIDAAYAAVTTASEAVRVKRLELEKSSARHAQAVTQAFPRLDVQASGSYMTNPPAGITVPAGSLGTLPPALGSLPLPPQDTSVVEAAKSTTMKVDATLSQPLFTWGKISNAIRLASLEVEASGAQLAGQERDTEHDVHTAYFGALLAEQSASALSSMRTILTGILEDRRKSFGEGTIIRQQVLEAESNVASLDSRLTDAEEARRTAYESLGYLTGLDPQAITLATPFRSEIPDLDEEVLKEAALKGSSALALSRTRVSQARARLDIERGGSALLPDLSLLATLEVTSPQSPLLGGSMSAWTANFIVSVVGRVRVIDSGESCFKVQQAQKDMEEAGEGLSGAEKALKLSVRKGVQAARSAAGAAREKAARLAAAEEQAKNARVSFQNGLSTREELSSAELALAQARLDGILAGYNLEQSLGSLEYITGVKLPR